MRKGRPLTSLSLTVEDHAQVVGWCKRPNAAYVLAIWLRIVSIAAAGLSNTVIASQLRTMQYTVSK